MLVGFDVWATLWSLEVNEPLHFPARWVFRHPWRDVNNYKVEITFYDCNKASKLGLKYLIDV